MRKFNVNLPQGQLEVAETGIGKPIVFVHGLLINGSVWDGVVGCLASDYRCIVPEFPFGCHRIPMNADADLSPTGAGQLIVNLIEKLELEDVTLVGGDFGAVACKVAAASQASAISQLILTNCDALEVFPAKGFEYFSFLPLIPGAMWCMAQTMNLLPFLRAGSMGYGAFAFHPLPDELMRQWTSALVHSGKVRRDAGKMMLGMDSQLTLSLPKKLGDWGKPVSIIWGTDDTLFSKDLGERLRQAIGSNATFVGISEAKTFVFLDAPIATARAIRDCMENNK